MSQDARRVDPSVVTGAKPAPVPGFVEPCHPTLREEAPSGERWVHEIKFDGYRTQAHLRSGRPAIHTRRGHYWTRRFQTIADALAALPADDLILDGEAVVADLRGIPDFGLLHAARRRPSGPAALLPTTWTSQHCANDSTRSLGEPRGFEVLAASRPGRFCKPRTRLQRL